MGKSIEPEKESEPIKTEVVVIDGCPANTERVEIVTMTGEEDKNLAGDVVLAVTVATKPDPRPPVSSNTKI